jgi:pyruvate-formate lyase
MFHEPKTAADEMLEMCLQREHFQYRKRLDETKITEFRRPDLSLIERTGIRFKTILENETPVVFKNQNIALIRTIVDVPPVLSEAELDEIKKSHFVHELGTVSNICPDYGAILGSGLGVRRLATEEKLAQCNLAGDREEAGFLISAIDGIDALYSFCERYRQKAIEAGNDVVAASLSKVPRGGASGYIEALQFLRILHYALWCEGEYHNVLGRFDQYMYPYFAADMEKGVLDDETALELTKEFFITFNLDSDTYPGVQLGDNGQSMMLGGVDSEGCDAYNALSEICLRASRELKLIDPKINLRVNKDTPLERYATATLLTKEGLGFPQYSNDDVVIPGLVKLGYRLEDARNYTVAACWEFIIPGYGMDIPNIGALSFPKVVDCCMRGKLCYSRNFREFLQGVGDEIYAQCDAICSNIRNLHMVPAPFCSALMFGCIEDAKDISHGCRYNNFGIHGTGIATAADSLEAIKIHVFEEKDIPPAKLVAMIDADFDGYPREYAMLRYHTPKMGNDSADVDSIATFLLDSFSRTLSGRRNERSGCFRAGTGSAMFYISHAAEIGASPDGRWKGEPFGANYSPSLYVKSDGPFSVVKSFTKSDLSKTINGGPLTMEFHSSIFSTTAGIDNVARLVKSFIQLGGHQLQLNAINRDILLKAQKEPENYRNLIVRVWGWSAYFVELDKEYQEHLISRQEYGCDK